MRLFSGVIVNTSVNRMASVAISFFVIVCAIFGIANASAEDNEKQIRFAKGKDHAYIRDVVGKQSKTYALNARESQRMTVSIASDTNTAVFKIYVRDGIGAGVLATPEIEENAFPATTWSGLLPSSSADYLIEVLSNNDSQKGKNRTALQVRSNYTLTVEIK